MELGDFNPLKLFKKGGNTAVAEPPPAAATQPQIMSAGGGVPPGNITAVANAEGHEPESSDIATMTAEDAAKAVPPTTGLGNPEDLKNTKVLEAVKSTSNN